MTRKKMFLLKRVQNLYLGKVSERRLFSSFGFLPGIGLKREEFFDIFFSMSDFLINLFEKKHIDTNYNTCTILIRGLA